MLQEQIKLSAKYYTLCYCGEQEYHVGRGKDDNGALNRPLGSSTDTPSQLKVRDVIHRQIGATTADLATEVLKVIISDACNREDPVAVNIPSSVRKSFKKMCGHDSTSRWNFIVARDLQGFQPLPDDYKPFYRLLAHCRGNEYMFWTTEAWRENRDFCGKRLPALKKYEVINVMVRIGKSANFIVLDGHARPARDMLTDIIEHACVYEESVQEIVERMCPGKPSVWLFHFSLEPIVEVIYRGDFFGVLRSWNKVPLTERGWVD
ncbi:hypothetical protein BV898_08875 [Hypsibius exemplaris]|uniref:Uncharacterized protein n=1 Tax=Hypsibius exemplaris TaxID=2072580 RepID=A0A1W0WP75_HYPEX|nr:hypothetical protein BV898_08875 [Hypsibius exemplaris]